MRMLGALGVLAASVAQASPSFAQGSHDGPPSAAVPDNKVAGRVAFIQARLDAGTPAATLWSYGWLGIYGAVTLGQFGIALGTKDPGFRADMAVGAASASLGVLPFALTPFTPRFAAAQLRALPARTAEERRRKLARAERLLKKCADTERGGHTWLPHVLGTAVAAAWGVVLVAAYDRARSGFFNTLGGVVVVEAQILTEPTAAVSDWDAYVNGAYRSAAAPRGVTFALAPAPGGIGLAARF